jgi:hypothetical protein
MPLIWCAAERPPIAIRVVSSREAAAGRESLTAERPEAWCRLERRPPADEGLPLMGRGWTADISDLPTAHETHHYGVYAVI